MAVYAKTNAASALLGKIKKAIDDGHITTWAYDAAGDFSHTPSQWVNKAWLSPTIETNRLVLGILPNTAIPLTSLIYGVYHGRFIEMLLSHFESDFTDGSATAGMTVYDTASKP